MDNEVYFTEKRAGISGKYSRWGIEPRSGYILHAYVLTQENEFKNKQNECFLLCHNFCR